MNISKNTKTNIEGLSCLQTQIKIHRDFSRVKDQSNKVNAPRAFQPKQPQQNV